MLYSMTGYGNAKLSLSNNPYEINILSLNSRNIDINVRTPQILKNLEIEIRKLLTEKLIRGKINVSLAMIKQQAIQYLYLMNQFYVIIWSK